MLIKNDIDLKAYYRFVEFLLKLVNYDLPHERFKNIILDNYKVESNEEKEVKQTANAYLYAMNNINQSFSKEIMQDIYYLLTHKQLNEKILNELLEIYYMNLNEDVLYIASKLHLKIIEKVKKRKIEFAFIITNWMMLKKQRNPIILYENAFKRYKTIIKKKEQKELMLLFMSSEIDVNPYPKNEEIDRDIIIKIIRRNKLKITQEYHVNHLYLYGSYAKERTTKQSDLDLLVVFDESLIPLEKAIMTKRLKDFLEEKIKIQVDILTFQHALSSLDLSEMENILSIIS